MATVHLLLILVALIALLGATFGVPANSRVNLTALGLFFWLLSIVVGS